MSMRVYDWLFGLLAVMGVIIIALMVWQGFTGFVKYLIILLAGFGGFLMGIIYEKIISVKNSKGSMTQ